MSAFCLSSNTLKGEMRKDTHCLHNLYGYQTIARFIH